MRVFRRALMGAEQPPLGQRRNLVYGGKQLAGLLSAGSSRPLAAPVVDVAELLQSAIALPAVGYDRRARFDVIRYEPVQRGPRCIRDRCDPTPAHPLGSRISTATPVSTFLPSARPPRSPGSSPPM